MALAYAFRLLGKEADVSSPIAKAWLWSLCIHVFGALLVCAAWAHRPAPLAMEIVDFRASSGSAIEAVVLDDAPPRQLPTVVALPLADSSMDAAIEPVPLIQPTSSTPMSRGVSSTSVRPVNVASHLIAAGHPVSPQPAFFGVRTVGRSVVYVVDRSASMGLHGRLHRAVSEVGNSIRALPTTARFQVVGYNRQTESLRPAGLHQATTANVDLALQAIFRLSAEGSTDHVRAIKTALSMKPDVVYFLTDEDELTFADVDAVTQFNRGQSAIHTFCLVSPTRSPTPLHELSRLNRGDFQVIE